jgi:hypothetical protein
MTAGSNDLSGFVRNLGEAARNNPVSAALIGMGAVWLFASRTRRGEDLIWRGAMDRIPKAAEDAWKGAVRSGTDDTQAHTKTATDGVRERGEKLRDRAADTGDRWSRTAGNYAGELPERARHSMENVSDRMAAFFNSQPLAIGAVGLAIGAAIAAAFPVTETEEEYLGESSDMVKQKAGEFASEGAQRAANAGSKAMEAAADEAQRQGLTGEGLKSAASDLSEKVARVAEAAVRPRSAG